LEEFLMPATFADCNPVCDPIEGEIMTSSDLLSQTGDWTCFKFISWLSFRHHSRLPSGSLKDSGRILVRTLVPAGLFMNLNKQSHNPSSFQGAIDVDDGFSDMTERVADCIRNVVPHPIAIFTPGKTPLASNSGDFPAKYLTQIRTRFEGNPESFTELIGTSDRLADPHRFSDGSCAFILPLVHDGALEAVLCLYDQNQHEHGLKQQHLDSLQPICQLAAMFIAHGRRSKTKTGKTQSQVVDKSEVNSRALVPFVSGLLRTISHDIRTPITTVRGFVKMMLDGRTGPISDPQRECLRMAFQGIDQLIRIGTSVSDASGHIEKINAEILDFSVLWHEAVEAYRPELLAKSVTIDETVEGDRRSVCGDRQYLTNLLKRILACVNSAVEQGAKLRVEIRCRNEIALMLTFPVVPGSLSPPVADEELAPAREVAFLHGGQITLRPGKEGNSTLMLTLPGYNE
jgi:hypothetical protein